jgi:hypothetical protein
LLVCAAASNARQFSVEAALEEAMALAPCVDKSVMRLYTAAAARRTVLG